MRGTMLWFNEAKDFGYILTEEGTRLFVGGSAFAGGPKPKGRCARAPVSYEVVVADGDQRAADVVLLPEEAPRRARMRHTRGR
jgi:cold shock CspA family protein